ncbi:thiol:disulfide interchange protein DsbA/DsbL [Vibrio algivorus]|uniref:Lipoprotein n=1 Tax=Vibrio algivorus TaxID=1667024 RepID=A0ABQ6EPP4_9VIBR|nr:thiol:disulfide interchange protein DsbA/DsbL [Vibrio algivorus]GLT14517.1 lipoprotein [Vibrio algivorus]
MLNILKNIILLTVTAFFIAGCSDSDTPKQGEQYQQLTTTLTQPEVSPVTEVFSLTCGHCRNMEASLPELEKLTGQDIGKVHVTFNDQAQVAALIYYAAVMQLNHKPDEAMMKDLFSAIQLGEGSTISQQKQAIEQVFTSRHMISPYSFDDLQQKALFRYLDQAMEISKQGGFNSVPTFIVNGKYEVLVGGHQDINEIAHTINFLLKQP